MPSYRPVFPAANEPNYQQAQCNSWTDRAVQATARTPLLPSDSLQSMHPNKMLNAPAVHDNRARPSPIPKTAKTTGQWKLRKLEPVRSKTAPADQHEDVVDAPIISPRTGSSLVAAPLASADQSTTQKLYLFGGASPEEGLSNAVYSLAIPDNDQDTIRWTRIESTTPPPPPRYDHAAVLVPFAPGGSTSVHDATMVVIGGAGPDGACLNDVWAFSLSSHKWSRLATTGPAPSPRTTRGAVAVVESQYLVAWSGGQDGANAVRDAVVAVLDLVLLTWSTLTTTSPSRPSARLGHQLVAVSPLRLVLVGGMDGATVFNDVWALDIDLSTRTASWTRTTTYPHAARAGHAATVLPSGAVLCSGGMTADHQIAASWIQVDGDRVEIVLTDGPSRLDHAMVAVGDAVVMVGGMNHEGIYQDVHAARVE
ncbi:hypothetical protein AMAG_03942 [Allomyces macrogynus ATCC 38327]|uniref:Uncharacterized protein n=1 Tax=Allomyces macrogynus (strain ATCC 38327) TaxID=578462 RepID=A0A0L0S6X4_ALLM3|nr:hypothetical protein AMAG_03942 [Allomyces macrogynus ATCC 38327]|eukprot:KNE58358.1 hypothetical protein AMAG_03942 [Allomyces macrogynus ATCC 38327]